MVIKIRLSRVESIKSINKMQPKYQAIDKMVLLLTESLISKGQLYTAFISLKYQTYWFLTVVYSALGLHKN